MGDVSSELMKLRPVTFRYKPECANGPRNRQYGLIAEEVAEVYPDLVEFDPKTGLPETVYYQYLGAMLVNEMQKQEREITALKEEVSGLREQNRRLASLEEQVSSLSEQNKELSALKVQIKELSAMVEKGWEPPARLSKLEDR
jgi:SMC interacting uncharacterized protein involved in chromosome segregation